LKFNAFYNAGPSKAPSGADSLAQHANPSRDHPVSPPLQKDVKDAPLSDFEFQEMGPQRHASCHRQSNPVTFGKTIRALSARQSPVSAKLEFKF
jgi:hypothetical protein